ncbi:hypothetical protein TBR22_A48450 [Luteitalea sp. TBR-22]|uniref:hypothetical protein n=1 Tax=Luteitalea sp. TBR-22 TaxID=2802971 RepID=UPI001AF1D9BB|nr:hypothetical protein [Luteitalea sp. TBR-22]BCS35611.1 hypothetical protein TBR22_A48450 [Luteitalea sp. TBR-22]
MVRTLVRLVILGLLLHAAVRIVPEFWHYLQFKDAVVEVASYPGRRTNDQLRARIAELADENQVPIVADDIAVSRQGDRVLVSTAWTAQLEYIPRRYYPYDFIIDVEGRPERFNGF